VERRCEFEACAVGTGCLGWFLHVESSRALLIGRRHPPDFNFTTKLTDRVVLIEGRAPLPTPIRSGQIVALPRNHWFSGNNLRGDVGLESLDHFLPPPLHSVVALHVGTHHEVFLGVQTRTLGLGCYDYLHETECYNSTCSYLLGYHHVFTDSCEENGVEFTQYTVSLKVRFHLYLECTY